MASEIVKEPWMTDEMFNEWVNLYVDAGGSGVAGSAGRATALFRELPEYEKWFPGIKREDGNVRYDNNPELTYYNNINAFRNTVEGFKMTADTFNEDYISLIEGDVSPAEFEQRTNSLYDRVLKGGAETRDWYAQNLGIPMTDEGMLASLMSNRVETALFNREITLAEIGGQSSMQGFDLTTSFVEMLADEGGMDRKEANRMFGSAASLLPALGALARRHGDPDDTFDITEFAEASALDDPIQLARMGRLQSAEQSQFTGGAEVEFERNRATGGVSGLAQS